MSVSSIVPFAIAMMFLAASNVASAGRISNSYADDFPGGEVYFIFCGESWFGSAGEEIAEVGLAVCQEAKKTNRNLRNFTDENAKFLELAVKAIFTEFSGDRLKEDWPPIGLKFVNGIAPKPTSDGEGNKTRWGTTVVVIADDSKDSTLGYVKDFSFRIEQNKYHYADGRLFSLQNRLTRECRLRTECLDKKKYRPSNTWPNYYGTIYHELGHVFGLEHEQYRNDAEAHIELEYNFFNNIFGELWNYKPSIFASIARFLTGDAFNSETADYDFMSSMHYDLDTGWYKPDSTESYNTDWCSIRESDDWCPSSVDDDNAQLDNRVIMRPLVSLNRDIRRAAYCLEVELDVKLFPINPNPDVNKNQNLDACVGWFVGFSARDVQLLSETFPVNP